MLKIGDLVVDTFIDRNRIGTVIKHHNIGDNKYFKVLWIATENYPVSVKDFYEDYSQDHKVGKSVFVINDIESIPKHLLPSN